MVVESGGRLSVGTSFSPMEVRTLFVFVEDRLVRDNDRSLKEDTVVEANWHGSEEPISGVGGYSSYHIEHNYGYGSRTKDGV